MTTSDDEWWASLTPRNKASIRRWLDKDSSEKARREAAEHPDQMDMLSLLAESEEG